MADFELGDDYTLREDSNGDLVIVHATNGDVLKYDASEDAFSALKTVESLTAGSLVIGGTLYEEDANSPIDVTGASSHTHTMADPSDKVIIIPRTNLGSGGSGQGFDQLQVNGDTGQNYEILDNSDTNTPDQTEWSIPQFFRAEYYAMSGLGSSRVNLSVQIQSATPGLTIGGTNANVAPPISQFTLSLTSGSQDAQARVYRREMEI